MSATVSTPTVVRLPIFHGGSKDLLISQLHDIGRFNRISERPTFPVTVSHPTLRGSGAPEAKIGIVINGMVSQTDRGTLWSISGFIPARYFEDNHWLKPYAPIDTIYGEVRYRHTRFREGIYNTQTRSGGLIIEVTA